MKKNMMVGSIFIIVGAFLLAQKLIGIDVSVWSFIWPMFLLVPGILLQFKFISLGSNSNNYVFAGILVTYGILFLINNMTNGEYNSYLSFGYPLGIGIGFLESYAFGQRKASNLSISVIFFIVSFYILIKSVFPNVLYLSDYILPGILIVLGVFVIARGKR